MTVGIVGMGLIGGSMARAYSKAGHRVLACEKDQTVLDFSMLAGAVVLNTLAMAVLLSVYSLISCVPSKASKPHTSKTTSEPTSATTDTSSSKPSSTEC